MYHSRPSDKAIRIGSINGDSNETRSIESIFLGAERDMEGVLVPELALNTAAIQRPNCMSKYDGQWAVQLGCHHGGQIPAQVLIGVDMNRVFPVSVVHTDGTPVQTKHARLVRSMLTGRYLLFGSASPKDELYYDSFPEIDDGPVGVGYLGAEAERAQLAEYYAACVEDIVTIQ